MWACLNTYSLSRECFFQREWAFTVANLVYQKRQNSCCNYVVLFDKLSILAICKAELFEPCPYSWREFSKCKGKFCLINFFFFFWNYISVSVQMFMLYIYIIKSGVCVFVTVWKILSGPPVWKLLDKGSLDHKLPPIPPHTQRANIFGVVGAHICKYGKLQRLALCTCSGTPQTSFTGLRNNA